MIRFAQKSYQLRHASMNRSNFFLENHYSSTYKTTYWFRLILLFIRDTQHLIIKKDLKRRGAIFDNKKRYF